jgi:hypothetical protein
MEKNVENEGPSMSPDDMIRAFCKLPGAEIPPDFHLYAGIWRTISRRVKHSS